MDRSNEKIPQIDLYPVVLATPEDAVNAINSVGIQKDVLNTKSPAKEINVEKSNDVVIGPMTQFHGPVTIQQTASSQEEKSAKSTETEKPEKQDSSTMTTKVLIYTSVLFLLAFIVAAITVPLVLTPDVEPTTPPETTTTAYLRYYTKKQWGGQPARSSRPLAHPTSWVMVAHTAGKFCWNFDDCASTIQAIQSYHMMSSPDIGYNFLIAGDGYIYEGRGWDAINFHRGKNIGVSFVGDFTKDELEASMVTALIELLDEGLRLEKLAKNYNLVGHNQTSNTLSPGENVYKVISKFEHFKPGKVEIN